MIVPNFSVTRDEMRQELAADVGRGGYVYRTQGGARPSGAERYFEKSLVLSRPGLTKRSAKLLVDLISDDCERVAATDTATAVLASAIAQETGLQLLLGTRESGGVTFEGEAFPGVRVIVLEDVILTGTRALGDVSAVRAVGGEVLGVVCLLDRNGSGAQRLAEAGVGVRALYHEAELLAAIGGEPR